VGPRGNNLGQQGTQRDWVKTVVRQIPSQPTRNWGEPVQRVGFAKALGSGSQKRVRTTERNAGGAKNRKQKKANDSIHPAPMSSKSKLAAFLEQKC